MTSEEIARVFEQIPNPGVELAPPDGLRRQQFRVGWEAFVMRWKHGASSEGPVSWSNLGYRFGKLFGPQTTGQIDEVFEHLVRLYEGSYPDGLTGLPGEIADVSPLVEGAVCRVTVNAYERNREAVRLCKQHHGTACVICGFDFGLRYGAEFSGFIHAHHLQPISEAGGAYVIDPIADLLPVCPNCHAVIHHGGRLRPIDEVRQLLTNAHM